MPMAFDVNAIDYAACIDQTPVVCAYDTVAADINQSEKVVYPVDARVFALSAGRETGRAVSYRRLRELRNLRPDWDGYGAESVHRASADNAEMILALLPAPVPTPDLTPNPNGTLTLDWDNGRQTLSLEVGDNRYSSFLEELDRIETDEGSLTGDLPVFVACALAAMFQFVDQVPLQPDDPTEDAQGFSGSLTRYRFG